MVVNKKQNPLMPPTMGSRTNSTQPLPRAKATSNSKPISTAGPISSSQKKSKQKKPMKSLKSTTKSSSMMDKFLVIMLAIFSTYALWTCPSDPHLSNPVCRSLSQYRTHVLDPYVLPLVQKALSDPHLAPAVSMFHDVERVLTPIAVHTRTVVQPLTIRATKLTRVTAMTAYTKLATPVYNKYIRPMYLNYMDPLYTQYVYPRVQLFRSRVLDPYLSPFMLKAHLYTNKAFWTIHRLYLAVTPRVHAAYVRALPYIDWAWETAKPYVIKAAEVGSRLFGQALERGTQARRQFVDPHVIRIWEKVIELSGSSRTTASSTAFAGTSFAASTTTSETRASSVEAQPETVQTGSSLVPHATTSTTLAVVTESSDAASVPDESSLPVETSMSEEAPSTSSASVTETSTGSDFSSTSSPKSSEPENPDVSFSPILAPGVADPIELPPSKAVEAESDNEHEPEIEGTFEAASSEEGSPTPEDELDDFFAELGIMDEEEADSTETSVVEEQQEQDTALTPEESMEARRVATAKKRAELEARMEKWHLDLDGLIKRRTKAFRKELVRVRKGAVRALFPDPEKDNSDLEEALTHIRGEDVSGILGRFEKESDKLLKGLDSYLKKEEKLVADSPSVDVDDRMKRWYNVVQRVEERFIERLNGLQEKFHWWYLEVRELEVQEYHRATKEVKTYAQKAQGDMGMPMAWLDDVTYQDWQKYHDLIRAHERFDEQIRMIQNGTHSFPPIDPLVPALDKLQMELEDVKAGFDARIRSLSTQVHQLLSPPEKEEQEGVTGSSSAEPASGEEEQVSILPIDPVPTSSVEQPVLDGANIILGKSKEQVEEAMSIAQDSVHEEL
ncbi:hypothetical protein DFH05DRAFT_1051892 [Lentinula detonsa]|uniref:Uncharacterized protein n=1 Tax=Lentinula detonsa TaxID=2804962 RepID=A0A9W8TZ06_9AGAR|nr:hypothetical protein DFH05DRAFT_1051892 [Lentinula detonsa]